MNPLRAPGCGCRTMPNHMTVAMATTAAPKHDRPNMNFENVIFISCTSIRLSLEICGCRELRVEALRVTGVQVSCLLHCRQVRIIELFESPRRLTGPVSYAWRANASRQRLLLHRQRQLSLLHYRRVARRLIRPTARGLAGQPKQRDPAGRIYCLFSSQTYLASN